MLRLLMDKAITMGLPKLSTRDSDEKIIVLLPPSADRLGIGYAYKNAPPM